MKESALDDKLIHKDIANYFNDICTSIQFSGGEKKLLVSSVKANEIKFITVFTAVNSFVSVWKRILLIDVCRYHYDYFIVATQPIGLGTEGSTTAHQCNAIVTIVEFGKHRRRVIQKFAEKLKPLGVEFLGVLLNKIHTNVMKYGEYGKKGKK